MNNTWLFILGILAAGLAAFLLLPQILPERGAAPEIPAVVEVETAEEDAETDETDEVESAPAPEPEPEAAPPVAGYSIDGEIAVAEYAHTTRIAGVEVHWSNDATYLRVGLVALGTGYVSIGFDAERQMEGANLILGYVRDGKAYFRDDFGTEPTVHMADTDRGGTNDIVASAGAEWADRTILEFIIPLDSGDEMDKRLVPGNAYPVIVAYHDLQDGFTVRHSGRGSGEIELDP